MTSVKRLQHIDALRGIAVALMVMVHAAATWTPTTGSRTSPLAYLVSGLGGLAAPLFLTLFGWGLYRAKLTARQRLWRAGVLFLCQFLVNIFAPHLFSPLTPGVLSCMAILLLTQPMWGNFLVRGQAAEMKAWAALCVLIGLTFFFASWQGPSSWSARVNVADGSTLASHLLLTGTYPLFPWICFGILGITIASLDQQTSRRFLIKVAGLGLAASLFFLVQSVQTQRAWALPTGDATLTFFPANAPFLIAAMTGVSLLWLLIERFWRFIDLSKLGQVSLSVYVVHFLPFSWLNQMHLNQAWTFSQSFLATVGYTVLWMILGTVWHQHAPQYTLEAVMRSKRGESQQTQNSESEE